MPAVASSRKAVVLLSGGLDSATTLAIAKADGFVPHALTVRYGQRHHAEVNAARRIAAHVQVADHAVVDVDLRAFGGSALTDDIPVPKDTPASEIGAAIPPTYVPARNTIFLSLALAWAEVLGAPDIFIGVNALDYSGYPDCRPAFLETFERLAAVATRAGVEDDRRFRIHAPLLRLGKGDIIRRGAALGLDFGLTVSCYDPGDTGAACGRCEACLLRRRGFADAGVPDPTSYRAAAPTRP